ncbi:hypothetical protein LEP1GSC090_1042 [Leptospira borgpetersenii serovar Javanica str. MK146]|nr:hypothetical protein LEP1GSC055_2669 [Leptospira borgpetersenii str. Brem 307]EMN58783.1 hypothetical protein LEP1GSC090_1042 [Leptospira borgpetersenii serovar Javanica str. MK146]
MFFKEFEYDNLNSSLSNFSTHSSFPKNKMWKLSVFVLELTTWMYKNNTVINWFQKLKR